MNSPVQPAALIEKVYAFVALTFLVGVFYPIVFDIQGTDLSTQLGEGNLGFQLLSGIIYIIAAVILLGHQRQVLEICSNNRLLLLFVLLILASSSWAELPTTSLRRSLALLGTTILAIYLAIRFPPDQFLKLLAMAMMVLAVESLCLALWVPKIGVHPDYGWFAGAWRGALGFKNDFGRYIVLAALVFWILSHRPNLNRFIYLGFFALSVFLIIKSQSRSAWVVFGCLVMLYAYLSYLQNRKKAVVVQVLVTIGLSATFVMLYIVPNLADLLAFIGRDVTLTGRTQIWTAAISIGLDRPWLGHGYRSFWIENVEGFLINAGHGHNSFLDMWLELGFVGLGLFLATFVKSSYKALVYMQSSGNKESMWQIMFMVYVLMYAFVAKVIPDHGTIAWVLYVMTHVYQSANTRTVENAAPAAVLSPTT